MDKKLKTNEMENVSGGELPPFVSGINYDKSLQRFCFYKKELKKIKSEFNIAKNPTEKKILLQNYKKTQKIIQVLDDGLWNVDKNRLYEIEDCFESYLFYELFSSLSSSKMSCCSYYKLYYVLKFDYYYTYCNCYDGLFYNFLYLGTEK